MPLPFNPSTWATGAHVPNFGTPTEGGYISRSGMVYAHGSLTKIDTTGSDTRYLTGFLVQSANGQSDWTTLYDSILTLGEPVGPNSRGAIIKVMETDGGVFRFRLKSVWPRLDVDGSVYPGAVTLETIDGSPLQTFFSWGRVVTSGGQPTPSQIGIGGPIVIPKSGPRGEDADWLLISAYVTATPGPVVVVKSVGLWRSLNFGYSWEMVRDLTNVVPFTVPNPNYNVVLFTRDPSSGRLFSLSGASMEYSDDVGVTWFSSGGASSAFTAGMSFHPGNTVHLARGGTLTGGALSLVSCDGGVTFPFSTIIGGVNASAFAFKISPQEILMVVQTPGDGFLKIWWTDSGGEVWTFVGETTAFGSGDSPVFAGLLANSQPVVVGRNGFIARSFDTPRGSFTTRTKCPLASAQMATARPLVICGHPLTNICE